MPSARFRALTQRIQQLEKRFLPRSVSPTGVYSDRQLDLVRGYRLLAHAEIEAYLEDKARAVANNSIAMFRADGKPRHVLMSLLAFHFIQTEMSEKRIKEIHVGSISHLTDAIGQAGSSFNRMIAINHGIREVNILRLLLPVGFACTEVDAAWLSTVDSFGASRGETAHTSFRAQQQLDPQNEKNTVAQILAGLRLIDEQFGQLR